MTKPLPQERVLLLKHKAKTYCVIIGKDDWRKVSKHTWHIHHSAGSGRASGNPYARTVIGKKKVYLHRYITGAETPYHVDHKNHCTLDNRRVNLEVVTHEENMRRRRAKRKKKAVEGQLLLEVKQPAALSITDHIRGERHGD